MELEKLCAREAVDRVLEENIHGLELDQRCIEIAAFALAVTAWTYPDAGGYRPLPELNVACSGLAISAKKEEWIALAKDNNNLRMALDELYKQFKNAPVLGSLINFKIGLAKGSLFELKWEEVAPWLIKAISGEKDDEKMEMGVLAQGVVKAAQLLVTKYNLVITNVPYLKREKQSRELQYQIEKNYYTGRYDIANAFILRLDEFLSKNDTMAIVSPQNWLFLRSYKDFRKKILNHYDFNSLIIMGGGKESFKLGPGNIASIGLFILSKNSSINNDYFCIDTTDHKTPEQKENILPRIDFVWLNKQEHLKYPDFIISLSSFNKDKMLGNISSCYQGTSTGDNLRFIRRFWEFNNIKESVKFFQGTPSGLQNYDGRECVVLWDKLTNSDCGYAIRGEKAWGRKGVAVAQILNLPATIYTGEYFANTTPVIIPDK
jgi:hypothetical protein